MTAITLRPATPTDFPTILALNEAVVALTSPMDEPRLAKLHDWAHDHIVAVHGGDVLGFLLVMSQGSNYDSTNYQWFNARYANFLYVDRIVVSHGVAGMGVGTALYNELFSRALEQGVEAVTCEYNLVPLNEGSAAFHRKFGFKEVGQLSSDSGNKVVSMRLASVGPSVAGGTN